MTFDDEKNSVLAKGTPKGAMIDEMGIFRTTVEVAHLAAPAQRRQLTGVIVDTGSEYNWIPRPLLDLLQKALVPAGPVPAAAA